MKSIISMMTELIHSMCPLNIKTHLKAQWCWRRWNMENYTNYIFTLYL